jgi:2-iminobutanoate/2-iminopropanoate deaminase
MTPHLVHSEEASPAIGPYSHAAISAGLIFVSGQLPLDPATRAIVPGTAADQFRTALTNAETILASCGAALSDVVKTTVFVTDLSAFDEINAAYAERFGGHAPARSVVEVSRLPRGASVEIELVASAGGR